MQMKIWRQENVSKLRFQLKKMTDLQNESIEICDTVTKIPFQVFVLDHYAGSDFHSITIMKSRLCGSNSFTDH